MDAVEFLKKWRDLCINGGGCDKECPLYYDYCPLDSIHKDRDETLVSIVDYVERHGNEG